MKLITFIMLVVAMLFSPTSFAKKRHKYRPSQLGVIVGVAPTDLDLRIIGNRAEAEMIYGPVFGAQTITPIDDSPYAITLQMLSNATFLVGISRELEFCLCK